MNPIRAIVVVSIANPKHWGWLHFVSVTPGGLDTALHYVLLRVAGWAPDDLLYVARDWLARGRVVEVAQAVAFVALSDRIPMTPGDVVLLKTALSEADGDSDPLADLELTHAAGMPWWAMAPVYPGQHADRVEAPPYSLDLSDSRTQMHDLDAVDRAVVATVSDDSREINGLWRAWRCPAMPTPWPPPRRVYLVQAATAEEEPLPTLAARLQRTLVQAGETAPQVEVFMGPGDLPPYQRTALGCSALLWTAQATTPIEIATLFDAVDEVGGPGFAASRPTLADPDRVDVLAYLDAGSPLLMTTALMADVMDERHRAVVPMSYRTDGQWVWTDAVAYYLRHYGLAPEARLLHHIRARGQEIPPVDAVAQHRALAALQAVTSGEDG
jgi:hypothetical protein